MLTHLQLGKFCGIELSWIVTISFDLNPY